MNIRIGSIMMAATLIATSTGCGTMKNFLFGRGARCGLCSSLGSCLPTPKFGNMASAPCSTGLCPTGPVAAPAYAPAPAYQSPVCNSAPIAGNPCECENYADHSYGSEIYSSGTCGCGQHGGETYLGESYGPISSDPYLNSGQIIQGSVPNYGQPIPSGVTSPLTSYPQSYPTVPSQSDGFQARKFDSDGNKILWEEPLPAGARAQ